MTKDVLLKAIEQLPDDATIKDAIETLYFMYKVEQGLADVAAGRFVTHEEVKRLFGFLERRSITGEGDLSDVIR